MHLDDRSRIVQTCALQALVDISEHDATLRERAIALTRHAATDGTPAVRARARQLLAGRP